MDDARREELERRALKVRAHAIGMATDGGCFLGASLSCADLLVYLYSEVLSVQPDAMSDPRRDYFFLSKGHDVPALYGTLAELGFIDQALLGRHLRVEDDIYWHPNRRVPGVEFHSGSLGHLLSVAIGVALEIRMRGTGARVFVLIGDGELNEGSMWEGILVARANRLDNLVVIVDRNGFQANVRTEDLIPLEPLGLKFLAFGWGVRRIDGHGFGAMESAFASLPAIPDAPTVVIADTIRGRGVPSIEQKADRWFVNLSHEEVAMLIEELHGGERTALASETLMVR